MRGPGKNNHVTPEIAARLLLVIAEGKSTYRACRENGVTTLDWIYAQSRDPELQAAVAQAEKARAQLFAEESVEIADSDPDPARSRVRTYVRMKLAGFHDRNKYGEQAQGPQINLSFSGALADARTRVLNAVPVTSLPAAPAPGRAEYCDLGATNDEPAFVDPLAHQGDSIVTRPDNVARELAELVRLPRTLGDALD